MSSTVHSTAKTNLEFQTFFWVTAFLWLLLQSIIVWFEVRFPGTDVFLFKEAGVNFALRGKLVAANLIHMPPNTEVPFSFYPPLYPSFFGFWSRIFGLNLKSSLAFECLIRGIRTLLLFLFITPYLCRQTKWKLLAASCLFLVLSLVSTDNDRPDDLAILFGLLSWFFVRGETLSVGAVCSSGIFLGLTAACSPAGGAFFTLGILFRFWPWVKESAKIFQIGLVSVLSFFLCNLPILLNDPSASDRFRAQAEKSSLPYKLPFLNPFEEFRISFQWAFQHFFRWGRWYLFCLVVLSICFLSLQSFEKSKVKRFGWAGIVFSCLVPVLWTLQPYYLWFGCFGVLVATLVLLFQAKRETVLVQWLLILIAFSPLVLHEAKGILNSFERPAEEASQFVRSEVLDIVKPGEKIAVTPDQFFTFKPVRQVSNIYFVCQFLDEFDFVYISAIQSSKKSREWPSPIPCDETKCFQLVKDLSTAEPLKILSWETPYLVRGNGGALYRNFCNSSTSDT